MTKPFAGADLALATAVAPPLPAQPRRAPPAPLPLPAAGLGDLSEVVARIYDTALDPSLWGPVLREVSEFTGGWGAAILSKDPAAKAGTLYRDDGQMSRERVHDYFTRYVRLDMYNLAHCLAEVGEPVVSSEVYGWDELTRSRLYEEWIGPQGICDFVNVPMDRTAGSTSMFGVFRREAQGQADDAMRERVEILAAHIRRAVQIGSAMERASSTAASLSDALDGLAAGVFLLDEEGRLVHSNARARAMLRERSVVDLRGGRLAPRAEAQAQAFRQAAAEAARGDAASGSFDLDIVLEDREGEAHLAQVLPLAMGERRRAGAPYGAAAAVFVRRAAMEAPGSLKALAERFELTATELRVLVALAEVGGVPEVAESMGVAVSTVKTHVHRLLGKTGTARQADLVKLLAGWSVRLLA